MPRPHPTQTSWAAGELSPKVYGRMDVAKFWVGGQQVLNYLVLPQGGVTRRPGTRFVAAVKTETSLTLVRRFEFNVSNAYILELGAGYVRFYKTNARLESSGTPIEVSTPYAAADLRGLDFVQSADVLYFLHPDYATRKLERYSDTCWRFRTVTFTPPPTLEFGARPVSDLEPGALSGENVTLTAHNAITFSASDVGREVLITAGTNAGARAGIKTVSSAQAVVVNVCEPWLTLDVTCNGSWKVTESPKTTATIAAASPVGASTTVTLGAAGWRGTTALSDSDCGRFVLVNGGSFEITRITSSTVAQTTIRGVASGTTAAQAGAWSLEEALWSAGNGFAETGTFHEDRLYLAAGYRFAGSKSSDYENYGVGTADDDAVVFAINSNQINAIRWMLGAKSLFLGTAGAEYVVKGGTDSPVTPTNILVSQEATNGSSGVPPVQIDSVVLFLDRSQRRLLELAFVFEDDGFKTPDLLLLADHLTNPELGGSQIVDLAYQRTPDSRLWAVTDCGVLLSCTYRRDENVVAWSRHTTCGFFESVAVIPHPNAGRDQVWVSTRRLINNITRRFIEFLDDCGLYYSTLNVDAAVTCEPAGTVTTIGNLGHLENMNVAIVGDGAVYPNQTVGGGAITISPAASRIEVGLPYTSTLETMRPDILALPGMGPSVKRRWVEIVVRVLRTLGMSVRTDQGCTVLVPFRRASDLYGQPPALFTGDVAISKTGWDCGVVTIQQTQPLPSTVLMLSGTLDVGGG